MTNTKNRLEAAEADLAERRAALAAAVAAEQTSEFLGTLLESVAKAEAVRDLEVAVASAGLEFVWDRTVGQVLVAGADDRWSGRGNDLRRSRHDAVLRWLDLNRPERADR